MSPRLPRLVPALGGLALLALVASAGCAETPLLVAAHADQMVAGQVEVVTREIDGSVLKLTVQNLSSENMTLDRDALVLETPGGSEHRLAGGVQGSYVVLPHGVHDLNAKFDLGDVARGQVVSLHVDEAITIAGRHVGVPPLTFQAR